jgi:outer membrane autotransporter protein
LWSLDTSEQLKELIEPLLIAELAANAQMLPLHNPYFRVFNHINNLQLNNPHTPNVISNIHSPTTLRGQSTHSPVTYETLNVENEFWFEGYYHAGNVNADTNALNYKTSCGGMMIGVNRMVGNKFLAGLTFGYGTPQAYNSVGKIKADDYMFGVYAQWKLFEIYTNFFLAYGNQNYKLDRNFNNIKYNGDSLYANLELFKPIYFHNNFSVSPLIAIDFQKAWSDGFNINVTGFPLSVGKRDIDQTVLRIGLNFGYKNFQTRLQYGYQLGGDLYGISPTSIVGGKNNRNLTSASFGRNTLNIGFGGNLKINTHTKLFADYDCNLGERSTTHTGQFGLVTTW